MVHVSYIVAYFINLLYQINVSMYVQFSLLYFDRPACSFFFFFHYFIVAMNSF